MPAQTTESRAVKIRLRGVHKSFGAKHVLRGIDLDVMEAESIVLLGGSGTGKSVLLRHMIGLLAPDAGTVEVDGTDLSALDDREIAEFRRRYGMAFQEGALFDSMSVFDNVAFLLRRTPGKDKAEIKRRVEECLELVQLEGTGEQFPSELSGGMRRRVGFARSIAHKPDILLFDEPNTGLDPVNSAIIDELIVQMRTELRSTTVTITHDLRSAFRIANRVIMLHQGEVIAAAPPAEFESLDDPRVRQFVAGDAVGPLTF